MVKNIFYYFVIIVLPLFLYLKTLAPGPNFMNYGDPAELQAASCTLGIAHPPGYPTYIVLGKLFTFLPFNKPAWRVNFMSAFFSICSLVLFFLICQKLFCSSTPAFLATLILAFSQNFWYFSLFAEMYSLNVFFTLLFLWFVLFGYKKAGKYYYFFFFLLGLAQGNHRNITLITPLLLLFLFFQKPKKLLNFRKLFIMTIFFLSGLSIYLFLPIRSLQHAYLNYNRPDNWHNFIYLVTSQQFRFLMFTVPLNKFITERSVMFLKLLNKQFFSFGLILVLLGFAWFLFKKKYRELVLFVLIFLITTVIWLAYNTDDVYRYLTPSFVMLAFFISGGINLLISLINKIKIINLKKFLWVFLIISCVSLITFLIKTNYSKVDLSQDWSAYNWGINYMSSLKKDAVVISYWAYSATMWYLQGCEKLRPDILVADDRVILDEGWMTPLNTVRHFIGKRPVYIIPLGGRVEEIENGGFKVFEQNGIWEVLFF